MAYSNNDPKPFCSERITGTGNLCDDPRIISGPDKTTVTVLRVAANSRAIGPGNKVVENTNFRSIKLFGWSADNAADTLRKGDAIAYSGRLSPHSYESNKTGEEVIADEVLADFVGLVPRNKNSGKKSYSDDEDDAPRSRSRSRRSDDDEDDAPRSRSRSRRSDDDEDDAPRSRSRSRRSDDDDVDSTDVDLDDLDEKPKRRRRAAAADTEDYTEDLI